MKTRPLPLNPRQSARDLTALSEALAALPDAAAVTAFLRDLCTPAELEAMADRWKVVAPLIAGTPYRDIHDATGVSVTTIGRVARTLSSGSGGYGAALRAQGLPA